MKKIYSFHILLIVMFFLNNQAVTAQSTEVFEDETFGSTIFSDNGQSFIVSSTSTDTYAVNDDLNGGWNGTAPDSKFVDNYFSYDANNESSFTITTSDGTEIIVSSLYLFLATNTFTNPTGTLTINGKLTGSTVFTITKSSGFADVVAFDPNSGYTFIDFATEGASDYSILPIDELEFISDGDIDYMGLDAFTWDFASTLSLNNGNSSNQTLMVYPNPATDFIKLANLKTAQAYEIFNVLGNKIQQGKIVENQYINIQDFSNGLYIMRLENGNSFRFIKE
ncbi:MAG: T9SS type A sorting domain-containing protein [Gelidibacter sp.]